MDNKNQTGPRPFPITRFAGPEYEAVRLMKRHYHSIRMRLADPYTVAHEVHGIMWKLDLLTPTVGLPVIQRAFASEDFKLRDRLITGSRNVFFPLLITGDEVKHHNFMDLIHAEMIAECRF